MKKIGIGLLCVSMSLMSGAQNKSVDDSLKDVKLDEVMVSGVRAGRNDAFVYSNLQEVQLKSGNAAKNIPAQLQTLPSVVSYSEGGTPVGNTSFRIRGTEANRINVTLNGLPLNDPETQEAIWVDLPDLSNSLKSIQLQRGVGTSTNGNASFGASVSMETMAAKAKAYGDVSLVAGQYNTLSGSAAFGTGILKNGLSVDARYSVVRSDGYIRNADVDHRNLFVNIAHYTNNQLIRLVYLNGIEHTGITWEGAPPEKLAEDKRYNPAGEYRDDNGNVHYYPNESDNYFMNILQLTYSRYLTNQLTLNGGLGYTNGYGYYENYRTDQTFSSYGLPNQAVKGKEYSQSDLIAREYLANNYYVGNFNLDYHSDRWRFTAGGMYGYFDGLHYGRVNWSKYSQNIPNQFKWYDNSALKKDADLFVKVSFQPLDGLNIQGEMQERYVDYGMNGIDNDLSAITSRHYYLFANPKLGFSYLWGRHKVYGQFGISNREPLRADLKVSVKGDDLIKPERLFDYELGYKYSAEKLSWGANVYWMNYKNQFVPTGKLNEQGWKLQENVAHSYRLGLELELAYKPLRWLDVDLNATLSRNKIRDYTAYFDYYDNATDRKYLGQVSQYMKSTNISFSPDLTGAAVIRLMPIKKRDISFVFTNKYVGRMYYDNTSNRDNSLPAYFVTDFTANYRLTYFKGVKVDLQLLVNNMTNVDYRANAWVETVKFADHTEEVTKGLFQQAGINVMGRVRVQF